MTTIKLPVRNERQYRRLYVLGLLTEPAHSGMQPVLPIPVETFAPPYILKQVARGEWREKDYSHVALHTLIVSYLLHKFKWLRILPQVITHGAGGFAVSLLTLECITFVIEFLASANTDFELGATIFEIEPGRHQGQPLLINFFG